MTVARLPRALVLAVAALGLSACAGAAATEPTASSPAAEAASAPTEITVTTATGDVTLPADPQRIVVFEHGILDTIDALGEGDRVVAIPHQGIPDYLAGYAESTENAGTLFEPDYEAVNAAEPDLIIVGGRSSATLEEMEQIAPTVDLSFEWGTDAFLATLERNAEALDTILGLDGAATAAVAGFEADAAAIAEDAASAGTGLVVLTTGGKINAFGPSEEGRFDFVYGLFGITPAAEQVAIDSHGDAISYEFLAETDADMLIVLDRDAAIGAEGESAQALLDNELVNGTSAAQNDAIAYVDTQKWYLAFGGLTALDGISEEIGALVAS
ncbi:siderophore ABC transporter substrate-binding protein [Demequina lignilytica]|uniref:ABC transporter substrate-binding protein n=1 Tax=Demequina lignilytica TaxID=3051663 RepID=A0AB35MJ36_9MICO|nr:ABC transporter substrate-binding protein [Demequina sp. SYSU T0a273]MDN4483822.1 ABC transporter substrate-binding protein [Demequina sp. SYSU T0a273]